MRISDWSSDVCSSDLLIAPESDRVAAVDRHDRDRRPRTLPRRRDERGERGGDFARAGIFQRDDLTGRTVAVDAGGERADAANIVGEIGDDEADRKSTRLNSSH